jgi:hypothetical protein
MKLPAADMKVALAVEFLGIAGVGKGRARTKSRPFSFKLLFHSAR